MKSLQLLICRLLQIKHLVITKEKDDGVKMVLSYRLQQNDLGKNHDLFHAMAELKQTARPKILMSQILMQ